MRKMFFFEGDLGQNLGLWGQKRILDIVEP